MLRDSMPSKVTSSFDAAEQNVVYCALNKYAAGLADGPARVRADRLLKRFADEIREAWLSEQRGDAALTALMDAPEGSELIGRLERRGVAA